MSVRQLVSLKKYFDALNIDTLDEFHHGNCVGADALACNFAHMAGFKTISHPCDVASMRAFGTINDETRPIKKPLHRNHDIVNECEILIASPESLEEIIRSGTWATVRYARKQNKPIILLDP